MSSPPVRFPPRVVVIEPDSDNPNLFYVYGARRNGKAITAVKRVQSLQYSEIVAAELAGSLGGVPVRWRIESFRDRVAQLRSLLEQQF